MFQQLSLKVRILAIVAMAGTLCSIVAILGFLHFNAQELEEGIIARERTIHRQLEAATDYVARQGGLDSVVLRMREKHSSPEHFSEAERMEILQQVPIFATMIIGSKNSENDHYQFRIFAENPRRKENKATAPEIEILKKFEKEPELRELIVKEEGVIKMYRPVRLSESQGCMTCHGAPEKSPWGDGRDILGYPMENWSDGKLHGVVAISQNIAEVAAARVEGQWIDPAGWLIIAIILGGVCAVLIASLSLRGPLRTLTQVVSSLTEASQDVNTASEQIAGTARGLSDSASRQASSLEETSASIEEMSSMVAKNAENANSTSSTSAESRRKAEHGHEVMAQMMTSMTQIHDANSDIMKRITQSSTEMAEIVAVIQNIGAKTQVINDIVFKTQLLSFNASVEAARAGEHGQGFAVVAEEVGKLAQLSGSASQEIGELLEVSLSKVESIVNRTQTEVGALISSGQSRVEEGTTVAQQCARVLSEIVTNVGQVSNMAAEISTACREQDQGVRELTKAMHQLDQVTQQNAGRSHESADAATRLSEQSASLNVTIQKLRETIEGQKAA